MLVHLAWNSVSDVLIFLQLSWAMSIRHRPDILVYIFVFHILLSRLNCHQVTAFQHHASELKTILITFSQLRPHLFISFHDFHWFSKSWKLPCFPKTFFFLSPGYNKSSTIGTRREITLILACLVSHLVQIPPENTKLVDRLKNESNKG